MGGLRAFTCASHPLLFMNTINLKKIENGKYVIAVSGGVDSMVLIDLLRQMPGLQLIVAHVDHGVREDSYLDFELVQRYATEHGLIFEAARLNLGKKASEDAARTARYAFLQQCRTKHGARAIITAHHQDDLIETALIAIIRGTGWRGLAPFVGNANILRPLINYSKNAIIAYARANNLRWREDSTNADERYLRNYIRRTLTGYLDQKSSSWRDEFLQKVRIQQQLRQQIEPALSSLHTDRRYNLIMMNQTVAYEVLQSIMRSKTGNSLERKLAQSALLFIKVAMPGKMMPLSKNWQLRVESAKFIVEPSLP